MADIVEIAAAPDIDWSEAGTEMQLSTIKKKTFSATFSEETVFHLRYGESAVSKMNKGVLDRLVAAHRGEILSLKDISACLEDKSQGTFFSRTRVASYVGPLLVELGYAVWEGKRLRFA
ncbi:hypothetical protein [Paraburkholderia lycopersici]|uniref:Uncharacterized protein n=1 Tax=Paraburkholderia lycopersici TaxID=416944 RepID=A0A1G6ML50_9BURK|nr:hypothetical protein [Paraburkholderia lycopersici]SDC56348.1 hypothetical protein SAMN05421548_10810 [Paraburkholderia lycopersici]